MTRTQATRSSGMQKQGIYLHAWDLSSLNNQALLLGLPLLP